MKNYRQSDFVLNKCSENIVYPFSDRMVEITLVDFLAHDPEKTAEDFANWKALSDEIYHQQEVDRHRTSKLDVYIEVIGDGLLGLQESVLAELIKREEKEEVTCAVITLFQNGSLTNCQKERFVKYYFHGMTMREIASQEDVNVSSVSRAVKYANNKFENILKKI